MIENEAISRFEQDNLNFKTGIGIFGINRNLEKTSYFSLKFHYKWNYQIFLK